MNPNDRNTNSGGTGHHGKPLVASGGNDTNAASSSTTTNRLASDSDTSSDHSFPPQSSARATTPYRHNDMSLFSLLFTGMETTTPSSTTTMSAPLPEPLWPGLLPLPTPSSSSSSLPPILPYAPSSSLLPPLGGAHDDERSTISVINQALALVEGIEDSLPPLPPSTQTPTSRLATGRPTNRIGTSSRDDHRQQPIQRATGRGRGGSATQDSPSRQ